MCQSGHSPVVTGRKKIPISLQDEYLEHIDSEEPEWDQTLRLLPNYDICYTRNQNKIITETVFAIKAIYQKLNHRKQGL